jgi:hypothetical protein
LAIAALSVTSKMSRPDGRAAASSRSRITRREVASSMEAAEMLTVNGVGAWCASPIARSITQRSISVISPNRSASGRKAPGGLSRPSSIIRSSSSWAHVRPLARSTIGWA